MLSLADISYTYSPGTTFQQRALTGASFQVSPGELVLIAGATGSGKSTLLRIAAGLLAPEEGTALIDGELLDAGSARGAVGLVFQNPESQLFADSVISDVEFGPKNLGESDEDARRRAEVALRDVGLDPEDFGDRSPFALSGGEARRVALAGILAMTPRYLLLDEPTAGLDARGRACVHEALGRVRTHTGVVVVSHDADEFLETADRVLVLAGGTTAFSGSAAELVREPTPLVEAGVGLPPLLQAQLLAGAAGLELPEISLDPEAIAAQLVRACALRGPDAAHATGSSDEAAV